MTITKRKAEHPNGVHAFYMQHVNSGSYYVASLAGGGVPVSDVCRRMIRQWNEENDDDAPLDFCTDRKAAAEWLNRREAQ